MEDSSKDLPKSPRTTAARPFFSPRASSGEGVTGPLELSRRRAAQLFTPPGPSLAPEPKARLTTSPAPDSEVGRGSDWAGSPMITPERTLDAESLLAEPSIPDDDALVVEMYEHEEIELTAAASSGADEHAIEVIAYDDANSLLRAAAHEGKHPRVDGLQLETTEFSFEQEPPPPRMNVESFWATEPFGATHEPEKSVEGASEADETESRIDADTAPEPMRASEPEPESERAAQAPTPMFADIAPPWRHRLTPVSSQALEEIKESEPWELAPPHSLEIDPEMELEASVPAAELGTEDPFLSIEAAPVAPSVEIEPIVAPSFGDRVADALARIAARVRDGELEVPSSAELSDEAALSAVLTSLLRARR